MTSAERELPWDRSPRRVPPRAPHLVLAWSLDEPERLGESIPVHGPLTLGRGGPQSDDPAPRAVPVRLRPDGEVPCPPVCNARISRVHLLLDPAERGVRLRSLARAEVLVNGLPTTEATVTDGDVVELHNAAVFLVVSRPRSLPPLRTAASPSFAFGAPDEFGIVGESESAWALRDALAFAASTDRHALLLGESGVGKELAARSIHGLSPRSRRPFVSRNAATLPEALVDAELFGNAKGYPNAGMPERAGLVGEAHESTLFLDEIGDLPESSQVHLLRALDASGEYHRLGEARPRTSSFRLVAATNRPLESLKHDFLARFTHRITVPGLGDRREDLSLVLRELLRRIATSNPAIGARFFERRGGVIAEPRIAPDLIARLLRHPFVHHVRELDRLVWLAIGTAEDDFIGVTEAVDAELSDARSPSSAASMLTRDDLVRALAEHGQRPTRLAKALGLKNRYVLLRLLKKHGLDASGAGGGNQ
jgi:two-component system nitrogen regulation response regulator GlnG/two-component system response regulator HydG